MSGKRNIPRGKGNELSEEMTADLVQQLTAEKHARDAALRAPSEVCTGPCPAEGHDGEHFQVRTHEWWMCGHLLAGMLANAGIPSPLEAARDEYRDNAILHIRERDQAREQLAAATAERDRLEEQLAAARYFAAAWIELFQSLPDDYECHMTCAEANAAADLYQAIGESGNAAAVLRAHAAHDEPGDSHYDPAPRPAATGADR